MKLQKENRKGDAVFVCGLSRSDPFGFFLFQFVLYRFLLRQLFTASPVRPPSEDQGTLLTSPTSLSPTPLLPHHLHRLFQHFVPSFADAFDRGPDDNIRNDPHPLCLPAVRIINSDSRYPRKDASGQDDL